MKGSLIAEAHRLVRLHVDGAPWSTTDIAMAAVCLRALLLELNPADNGVRAAGVIQVPMCPCGYARAVWHWPRNGVCNVGKDMPMVNQ